ncbi:AAA family ATPase [Coleofasciculus sp. F4-SAH-05]|uniref:AAA family ATPase n=1 Tax=Coleofasciculus sp. F4-SAH-05 TaxID=3069525 RepID=UPI0032F84AF0
MFKSITIRNFRCFEHFRIDNLKRVNLIGGVNNIGKTAFLEAIFLLSSLNSIELLFKLNIFRGVFRQETIDVEDICEWLFYKKNINRVIQISTIDEYNQSSELKLRLDKALDTRLFPINAKSNKKRTLKDLKLEYYHQEKQAVRFKIFLTSDEEFNEIKIAVKQEEGQLESLESLPNSEFISSRLRISPTEDAERFSYLEAINRQNEVIEILKILEPRLNKLAVLVTGGIPMIYGDIGLDSLIPVPLMGEGMGKLLSIVLSILNTSEGTVLIDEIENGLHYSILVKVWTAITLAARKVNTQIFATTHSWECIAAANEAFSALDIYDFSYYRLEREKESNNIKMLNYDRDTITTSVELNLEMR